MTVLRIIITVLIGLGLGVFGGKMGLRRLLYLSVALVAIFASLSAIKGAYDETVEYFRNFMRLTTASVLSFILLVFAPLLTVIYLGRKLIVRLQVLETISPMIDTILGVGYIETVFLAVLLIQQGGFSL